MYWCNYVNTTSIISMHQVSELDQLSLPDHDQLAIANALQHTCYNNEQYRALFFGQRY